MVQSYEAAITIPAQRIVNLSTAQKATLTTTAALPLGISIDHAETGQGVPVAGAGEIARLYFNDTVAANGLVTSDASGRGVPFTGATAAAYYVGSLLGAAVSATGTIADVLIIPGYASSE